MEEVNLKKHQLKNRVHFLSSHNSNLSHIYLVTSMYYVEYKGQYKGKQCAITSSQEAYSLEGRNR